ncbi:iron-sulfur cluster insertion protein ErpA [Castellaniella sp.]|uniref:iron-sulfur cluster insertion protein ErpA n=1 Tax=Castellaniella sp. TaxID=1955812 RepID=UPI003569DA2A
MASSSISRSSVSAAIGLTAAALARLRQLRADQGNPALKLRIYVEGGGCSGFQYGFGLEESAAADDLVIEQDGMQLLVDPLSVEYLTGAQIDYEEALKGSQFVVRNPNAETTCGCGSSFTA